jgi:pyruvate/2-oxoacid:ferredoxin oxidoreductase alpha subunit
MDLEEADRIRDAWGKFLEVANPGLMRVFGAQIPEAVLPYPKEKIEEAMDICIDYFKDEDNEQLVETFKATKAMLIAYGNSEAAVEAASNKFKNPEFLKVFNKQG